MQVLLKHITNTMHATWQMAGQWQHNAADFRQISLEIHTFFIPVFALYNFWFSPLPPWFRS